MTSGLGRNLDSVVDDIEKEYGIGNEPEEATNWTPFDWTSETYQLMCRQYRMSLGIVHPESYESNYQTMSEYLYWKNLYKVRGYGPYKRKQQVIPDPPEAWQNEWASMHGTSIRDVEQDEPSSISHALSPEQETISQEHLKRLESACLKDEKGETVTITDANLLSEFQIWMAQESLTVIDEMAKLIRDSWARIFDEDRRACAAIVTVSNAVSLSEYQEFD